MNEQLYEKRIVIISGFLIASFIGLFNETALNMAFAQLIIDFESDAPTIQWLTTGYLLTLGMLVPITSVLMQKYTTRQLFLTSVSLSLFGTLIAAVAPSFIVLFIGRIVQAAGTAIILPLMMQVVLMIYPPRKRGAAMGKIGLVIVFAPATGPTVAGIVMNILSWHFIFWLSAPFLIFALLIGMKHIENVSTVQEVKIDPLSLVLSTIGFGGIVYGFSISGKVGTFFDGEVLTPSMIGIIALVLFTIRQFRLQQPMLNLRVFSYRMYTLGVILIMSCMLMILSTMVLLPIYLQNILQLTPLIAGLVLLPGGIINALMSVVSGNLFDKYGPKLMIPLGLIFSMTGLFALRSIDHETVIAYIIVFHTMMFIGISLTMMPAQTNGLNELPKSLYPDGTAVLSTLQQVAGAIGTAVAITVMSITNQHYLDTHGTSAEAVMQGSVLGIQNSITLGLAIACIAFICSLFLKRVQ
ncbi:MAG TPA: DHA2 family efflux MFS transporter permease subunit [Sporosarcina sp.]|nr:DHA2 family efflux MFS transporter permease subunit [Sporosarcina sp.]